MISVHEAMRGTVEGPDSGSGTVVLGWQESSCGSDEAGGGAVVWRTGGCILEAK